jgi:uncharacterized protein YcfJ
MMDKSMVTGLVMGAVAVTAIGGVAGYKAMKEPEYAEVLSAREVTEKIRTPREVCKEVAVTRQAPVKDPHRIAGTAIGAVVGGALGSQIGDGKGKTIATVAGVAGGGYAGNKIQQNMQQSAKETTMQTQCKTVYDTHTKPLGNDVTYKIGDKQGTMRMDYKPGPRIPLQDGQLVIPPAASNRA